MTQFSDLDQEVILRCENKTSDLNRADVWLKAALLELTSMTVLRDDFDELEEYGSLFNLTAKTQEYPFSNVVPSGDYNQSTLDILIWQDPPTNSIRRQLRPSHYQKADNFQPTYALPTEWYRFGDTFGLTPVPDKNYQVQPRLLKRHPISNPLNSTTILIAQEWEDVLTWMAVERGFMEYLEFDKAAKIHTLLHGDPKRPERPGLILGAKKRREREMFRVEQSLRPTVRVLTRGGR